ncbi:hypothetical protein M8C21_009573 [Ambrosia artemisiifolia]|uniref:Uncharacterized protein n=1 Tax=Ambrosia artemisiifolia TaxID=4212 RepID=A0AAD5D4B6_AMBAR|nr:hypothetical protein M8C21_009573 [Ambrosia artemisiifolia]
MILRDSVSEILRLIQMNFYDFFNFVVRFSFANIIQLCHLAKSSVSAKWCSSCTAQNLIFNLESAKDIAIKMKLTCLSENHNISLDFRSVSEEPAFLELCSQLERTYAFIHDKHEPTGDMKKLLMDDLLDMGLGKLLSTIVCNPENLATLIDDTLQNLVISHKI